MVIQWNTFQFSLKEENEDICYTDVNMAWVLDGASGLYNTRITNHKSDAAWYVYELQKYLKKHLQDNISITQILQHAIIDIKKQYLKFPKVEKVIDYPSCAAAITRVRNQQLEYYVMADCELLIKFKNGSIQVITDQRVEKFDDMALQAAIEEAKRTNKSVLECQDVMTPIKKKNRKMKNQENGYYALADDPNICQQAFTGKIDMNDICAICICSDGFAQYYQKMQVVSDKAAFFQRLEFMSLNDMHTQLYQKQVLDKNLTKYPRFRLTDDNTIVYGVIKKDL